ncbi:pyruvate, phosphate dikinase [Granulicatella sp. zg-ZJ]|uniref:pyruvate, phosphate dikinase n=1 Tax=Granulicatella sp. zg-ZJ TaxID=2678504 RepID=UPI0013D8A925|nr:pyruvate, phosphate dikinase [Granulicatella sp. zg-ZJ]NEW63226.1 pyruvate, phosphate dikinase [Granulicatella sp. zg-ZJ]
MKTMKKYVYHFSEGNKEMNALLGGKGANLAEMTSLGVNVPPGFTITTEACRDYYVQEKTLSDDVKNQIDTALSTLEQTIGKRLGDTENPLLVSVRSGSVFSMPGMMDTVLNLGLNDETTEALARQNNDKKFAYDSYRRFIQMFSDVVMGIEKYRFEQVLAEVKRENCIAHDRDLSANLLLSIIERFKDIYFKETGNRFPTDVKEQLLLTVEAVFKSWNNQRAKVYRKLNNISDSLGTAVNVQAMVFGNMGNTSGTGVCFSRNPVDGTKVLFGEYLIDAQGEDVVAGIRTPQPIETLKEELPQVYEELVRVVEKLENHYKDMQDIEFTVENNRLYLLQTRNAKRTAKAAVEVAVTLVDEGILTKEEAILRITTDDINKLLHPTFDEKALKEATLLATGLAASPGAAVGHIYFTAQEAVKASKEKNVILLRQETSPEDIEGMVSSQAIVTSTGGMTSHAAVVARGMGKCCVCGCQNLVIDEQAKTVRIEDTILREGDMLSVDGSTGCIYLGEIKQASAVKQESFARLMTWVDEIRELMVYVNADNAHDTQVGLSFGAAGVGLCRTEHMFFEENRIGLVRKMILSNDLESRLVFLNQLEVIQRDDFYQMFNVLNGKSINIRLLDPPLHEFLPHEEKQIVALSKELGCSREELEAKITSLSEFNPMMGHRGCRLGVTYPEVYLMQAKAISSAAIQAKKEGVDVHVEIMIPLVSVVEELVFLKTQIEHLVESQIEESGVSFQYKIGTMIEIPRACFIADQLAEHAAFFSFGTNDLTQLTYGYSRDDASKFIDIYKQKHILAHDPFVHLDESGVLSLIKMAKEKAKKVNPNIKIGVCGEHGGDEKSVILCGKIGLEYVSCSPYRVLIAKLAAAKAAILKK